MKHRLWIALLIFGSGAATGLLAERLLHAQNEPVKRTTLLQTDLEGAPGKEVDVFVVEIAPGASTGKHSHPGSEFAYILEGTAAVEAGGNNFAIPQRRGTLSYLMPNEVHNVSNQSRTEPLKAIVFAVNDKGKLKIAPAK
jgi:quercetin dioxygenase-like cupin family protein